MVTIQKIQAGAAHFVETEITAQLIGWKKLVAETTVGLYLSQLPSYIENLAKHPMFASLGIIKDRMVDVDALYTELSKHFAHPVEVDIPMLGKAHFTKENLDTLYQMILNA